MKNKILLFIVVLSVACGGALAQSKKDLETSLAKATAEKDSLQKALSGLTLVYDSINKAYLSYHAMYNTLKDKVVKYPFDPARAVEIIDSLSMKRDSATGKLKSAIDTLQLKLAAAKKVNDSIIKEQSHLSYIIAQCIGKGTIPQTQQDLIGNWTVKLQKLSFDNDTLKTGIVITPALSEHNVVIKLKFVDNEMAEIVHFDGTLTKCFYVVNDFSNTSPFTIDLKGKDNTIRVVANPSPYGELEVSYRKGNGYLVGFMRRD